MSKLTLTDISAEIIDITTKDSEEVNSILIRWKVEYYIHHTGGHYWRGTFYWNERNFIIDDVITAIRKDLPKYTENENNSK